MSSMDKCPECGSVRRHSKSIGVGRWVVYQCGLNVMNRDGTGWQTTQPCTHSPEQRRPRRRSRAVEVEAPSDVAID